MAILRLSDSALFGAVALLAAVLGIPAQAQAPVETFASYTDVCMHQQSGDFLGDRIRLIKEPSGYIVKFQEAGGELSAATATIEGTATIDGATLTFTLAPKDGKRLSFKGRITPEEITGRFDNGRQSINGSKEIHWLRVASNQFVIGPCK
jgi:hypothetical protein